MITASMQHLSSIIRAHPDGGNFGAYWDWRCVVHWETPTSVILLAASSAPSKSQADAIFKLLHDAGVENIQWDRRRKAGDTHRAALQADRRFEDNKNS